MAGNELKKAVFDTIAENKILTSLDFKFYRNRSKFERKLSKITQRFTLVFLDGDQYLISPEVGIRFEIVEDIFHGTSGFSKKDSLNTATLGAALWQWCGQTQADFFQFKLSTEKDVRVVSEQLLQIFEEYAVPYFDRYSNLHAADEAINGNPFQKCPHRPWIWFRCSTGMILAKLVGRENFDELKDIYTCEMKKFAEGFYLPNFEALLIDLEGVTPENALNGANF